MILEMLMFAPLIMIIQLVLNDPFGMILFVVLATLYIQFAFLGKTLSGFDIAFRVCGLLLVFPVTVMTLELAFENPLGALIVCSISYFIYKVVTFGE